MSSGILSVVWIPLRDCTSRDVRRILMAASVMRHWSLDAIGKSVYSSKAIWGQGVGRE
jgi:hypothetical protein